ncbi:MAG: hypothetical protein PHW29_14180, partial [Flavobacterium sp.]|nr:hypothetical protein [Flavobacterium sp.]
QLLNNVICQNVKVIESTIVSSDFLNEIRMIVESEILKLFDFQIQLFVFIITIIFTIPISIYLYRLIFKFRFSRN